MADLFGLTVKVLKQQNVGLARLAGDGIPDAVIPIVQATAQAIKAGAQARARVDTGAMRASIYVSTGRQSDYDAAVQEAKALDPDVRIVPEQRPPTDDGTTAIVGVAASHGAHVEFGTPAQPFVIPAVEDVRPTFKRDIAKAIQREGTGG